MGTHCLVLFNSHQCLDRSKTDASLWYLIHGQSSSPLSIGGNNIFFSATLRCLFYKTEDMFVICTFVNFYSVGSSTKKGIWCHFSNHQWQFVFTLNYKSSKCINHLETSNKLLYMWYLIPYCLTKKYPDLSNVFWRCNSSVLFSIYGGNMISYNNFGPPWKSNQNYNGQGRRLVTCGGSLIIRFRSPASCWCLPDSLYFGGDPPLQTFKILLRLTTQRRNRWLLDLVICLQFRKLGKKWPRFWRSKKYNFITINKLLPCIVTLNFYNMSTNM